MSIVLALVGAPVSGGADFAGRLTTRRRSASSSAGVPVVGGVVLGLGPPRRAPSS
jgi:hypothetical protein